MSRKIDALVAKHVMGLDVRGEWTCYKCEGSWDVDEDGSWVGSGHEGIRPVYVSMPSAIEDADPTRPKILGVPAYALSVVPDYSTDIVAAWEVLIRCCLSVLNCGSDYWVVGNRNHETDGRVVVELANARGRDAVQRAICLAALRAVGVDEAAIQEAVKG